MKMLDRNEFYISVECPYIVTHVEWLELLTITNELLRNYRNGYYSNVQAILKETKQTEPEKEYDDLTSTISEQQEFERGCLERLDLLLKKQTEGGGG